MCLGGSAARMEGKALPPSIPLDGFVLAQLSTYVLAKILQNGAKFTQKLTPGFKNHMRNLDNFRQAVESLKSGNSIGYVLLSKKYIRSAKTLYTEDLSNITFNWCENSSNSSYQI